MNSWKLFCSFQICPDRGDVVSDTCHDRPSRIHVESKPGPGLVDASTLVERFDIERFPDFSARWANFLGLVLFCIDAKFCKKICVGKLVTRSTRFTCFCTAQTSIFQKFFVKNFRIVWQTFAKFRYFWILFNCFFLRFWWKLFELTKYCRGLPKNANKFKENLRKYWGLSGAKACKSCRSRHELSNAYLLARFGVDTAENESLKVCLIFI